MFGIRNMLFFIQDRSAFLYFNNPPSVLKHFQTIVPMPSTTPPKNNPGSALKVLCYSQSQFVEMAYILQ
jgi:hypothetical protein